MNQSYFKTENGKKLLQKILLCVFLGALCRQKALSGNKEAGRQAVRGKASSQEKLRAKRVQEIVGSAYEVEGFLGKGGEADVFLGENQAGQKVALKYWTPEKIHRHLRGITPFQNAVAAHRALEDVPHINALLDVFGEQVMVLRYVQGPELRDFLAQPCTKDDLISITKQFLDALCEMFQAGVMGFDTSAENVIVQTKDGKPFLTFIDTGAYLVKSLIEKNNISYAPNAFNLYNLPEVRKLMAKKGGDGVHYLMNDISYEFLPPLTFYCILAERVDLLSAILTKLWYVEEGRGQDFPAYEVKNRVRTFGLTPQNFVTPLTPAIQKRALALLDRARVKGKALPPYTEKDFERDWQETQAIFEMIKTRTETCLQDIKACAAKKPS
jgi:tRNA A-37 threonylcarbamoyl transferase component Bud32